ncbi:hypothetical protein Dimus_010021 [Dionaea muscipula]
MENQACPINDKFIIVAETGTIARLETLDPPIKSLPLSPSLIMHRIRGGSIDGAPSPAAACTTKRNRLVWSRLVSSRRRIMRRTDRRDSHRNRQLLVEGGREGSIFRTSKQNQLSHMIFIRFRSIGDTHWRLDWHLHCHSSSILFHDHRFRLSTPSFFAPFHQS